MTTKECGGCTLCCTFLEVVQLSKPANTDCKHCQIGEGCSIWEERPSVCRKFECLWKESPQISLELRPDLCGVLFDKVNGSRIISVLFDPDHPEVLKNPRVINLMRTLSGCGFIVGITRASRKEGVVWLKPSGVTEKDIQIELEKAKGLIGWQPQPIITT